MNEVKYPVTVTITTCGNTLSHHLYVHSFSPGWVVWLAACVIEMIENGYVNHELGLFYSSPLPRTVDI